MPSGEYRRHSKAQDLAPYALGRWEWVDDGPPAASSFMILDSNDLPVFNFPVAHLRIPNFAGYAITAFIFGGWSLSFSCGELDDLTECPRKYQTSSGYDGFTNNSPGYSVNPPTLWLGTRASIAFPIDGHGGFYSFAIA